MGVRCCRQIFHRPQSSRSTAKIEKNPIPSQRLHKDVIVRLNNLAAENSEKTRKKESRRRRRNQRRRRRKIMPS
ncbi:hypothetical protein QR680_011595 [Steinernema hermaphroditum]|uniref:Uncharacterized protein n=1 Tax=Steinernema hermaphroditum TaxID=289476 RepID=A0AA39HZ08_9BILA|nr:hypothetical protein QR680_011595 [Steinernema hermaphroditum]